MKNCRIHFRTVNGTLMYDYLKDNFSGASNEETLRYLKGVYTNKERFIDRFISPIPVNLLTEKLINYFVDNYDRVKPFSYVEAFKIEDQSFRALVFGSINITEMIKELGSERLKVEGKEVKRKQFDSKGNFIGYKTYNNIYETHKVFGKNLELADDVYVLKCWCTSTDKEHFIWIDEKYKDEPLEAVASTFFLPENIVANAKELKRQGDVLLVEMKEGFADIEPKGDPRPLTAKEYFGLLTSES